MTLVGKVQQALTADLLKPEHRNGAHPLAGHCYVASEALYHLLGGSASGWKPMNLQHEGTSHWFLKRPGEILDPTADQFKTPVPYGEARGRGFLTKNPSKRARVVMQRVKKR